MTANILQSWLTVKMVFIILALKLPKTFASYSYHIDRITCLDFCGHLLKIVLEKEVENRIIECFCLDYQCIKVRSVFPLFSRNSGFCPNILPFEVVRVQIFVFFKFSKGSFFK